MKYKRSVLWLLACWLLLALACQTATGGEEAAVSTSTALPAATNTTAVIVATEIVATELPTQPPAEATLVASEVSLDDIVVFDNLPRGHDPNLREDYGPLPPPGGSHNPVWQNCGFYSEPVWTEMALHSLEHGPVWIAYHPDLAADQIEYLRGLAEGRSYVLVTPYPDLASDVLLSAWGLQLQVPSVPDPVIEEFIAEYENGPQNPEPGAPCSGGFGRPE